MTANSVDEKLQKLICEITRINQNKERVQELSANKECDLIHDFGLDSLLMVQLIVEIESEFDIEFDLTDLNMDVLRKYHNLRDYIISHQE